MKPAVTPNPNRQRSNLSLPRQPRGGGVGALAIVVGIGLGSSSSAQAKTFIDYIKQTPTVCSPLSSATWGVSGVLPNSDVACPAGGACNDTHWDSNVSLFARHDGKFQIVQRHGFIAIADTLCGPYKMQKPTWTYPTANLPNVDSIYPKRTSNPVVTNPTYGWEEDPHIWRSGGTYHVLYSGSGDRVGWHLYSPDGIHDWKDGGLAYTPRQAQKMFTYEGTTTATQWYKCERPGVVLEIGHPTHITLAVADVDKDNQIPAGSNHGSKVLVIPFDGEAFDNDYGSGGSTGTGGTTGAGGATGTGGARGTGGITGAGGTRSADAGASDAGSSDSSVTGGISGSGGGSASGGATGNSDAAAGGAGGKSSGGASGSSAGSPLGGSGGNVNPASSGGASTSGGAVGGSGGRTSSSASATGGSSGTSTNPQAGSDGCGCVVGSPSRGGAWTLSLLVSALGMLMARRRRR